MQGETHIQLLSGEGSLEPSFSWFVFVFVFVSAFAVASGWCTCIQARQGEKHVHVLEGFQELTSNSFSSGKRWDGCPCVGVSTLSVAAIATNWIEGFFVCSAKDAVEKGGSLRGTVGSLEGSLG